MYIRMVVELVLMAIVMITTDPKDKSYVRYRCGARGFHVASTEPFVKFKSAVPGNSEIHDPISYLFSCSMAPAALV